MADKDEHISLF